MENYRPETPRKNTAPKLPGVKMLIVIGIILLIAAFFVAFKPVYFLNGLGQQEMGVKIRAGEIVDIVGSRRHL